MALANGTGAFAQKVARILFAGWMAVQFSDGYSQSSLLLFAEEGNSPVLTASQSAGLTEDHRPLPEEKIAIPQYLGLYAVDQGTTITFPENANSPTDAQVTFSKDVEFLYFNRTPAGADNIKLYLLPTAEKREACEIGKTTNVHRDTEKKYFFTALKEGKNLKN